MSKEELEVLSAVDLDEYYVKKIVAHEEKGKNPKNWSFKAIWVGYEPEEDSSINWTAVKDFDLSFCHLMIFCVDSSSDSLE